MAARSPLLGSPHCYLVEAETALGVPLMAEPDLVDLVPQVMEAVRNTFDVRLYAWSMTGSRLRLVLQHLHQLAGDDQWVRNRWQRLGTTSSIPIDRLRTRMTSLSGFMQTLLQRLARQRNRLHDGRGSIWARRYRACLLGDDSAVLIASAWCDYVDTANVLRGSQGQPAGENPINLAAPPLRIGHDGDWYPGDDSFPGLMPPMGADRAMWLRRVAEEHVLGHTIYNHALEHGWALGRPESLTGALQRLGREHGRGRSRRVHELDDQIGLCGIWG